MCDTQVDIALARAILAEPVLAHVVSVAAGTIAAGPAARRHCVDAIAELEAAEHPASAALRLAIEAARIDEVIS